MITRNGETLGEIDSGFFGTHTLRLTTGERFTLSTSFWEQEAYWRNEKGETIIKYQQATLSSMGKGVISLADSVTRETEKLLISGGLFARQARQKRISFTMAVMIPFLAALRQL